MKINREKLALSVISNTLSMLIVLGIMVSCHHHTVKVGDVYTTYYNRRGDSRARTNGSPSDNIAVTKIIAKSNGVVYAATFSVDISQLKGYGGDWNQWGPESNYHTYSRYYTLVKPIKD